MFIDRVGGCKNKSWQLEETITGDLKSELEMYCTRNKFFSSKKKPKKRFKEIEQF